MKNKLLLVILFFTLKVGNIFGQELNNKDFLASTKMESTDYFEKIPISSEQKSGYNKHKVNINAISRWLNKVKSNEQIFFSNTPLKSLWKRLTHEKFNMDTVLSAGQRQPIYVPGEIYVKISDSVEIFWDKTQRNQKISAFPFLTPLVLKYGIYELRSTFFFAKSPKLQRILRIKFSDTTKTEELIEKFNQFPYIEYAEKIPAIYINVIPNDPYYSSQQWQLSTINAPGAWNVTTGSSNIKIAIVDNAIQTNHSDLSGNMDSGFDVADWDNNPNPPNSSFDHGTHVTGIASAVTNNGVGISGIGWNCNIIPVKAEEDNGSSTSISHGFEGITWASQNGANIINCSWRHLGSYSSTEQTVIDNAWNNGCIIVAAAGNDGSSTPAYPAAYNHVVAVANSTSTDSRNSTSNYGSWVDVTAPGTNIYSTIPFGSYGYMSGTSMSSPLVAGLMGLVWSVNPNASQSSVISCLTSTAVSLSWSGGGSGRIDAQAAVLCASGGSAPSNDACNNAIYLTVGTSCNYINGTTIGATSSGFYTCSGNMNDDDIFYYYNSGSFTSITINVLGLGIMDNAFQHILGPCGGYMVQVPNGCVDVTSSGLESRTFTGLTPNTNYYIRVGSYGSGTSSQGNFQICVTGTSACSNYSSSPSFVNLSSPNATNGTFTVGASGNNCTYSLLSNNNAVSVSAGSNGIATYYVNANTSCFQQTYTVSVLDGNGTVQPSATFTIYQPGISQPGQPGNISGSTIFCSGIPVTYSISPVSNASSYSWSLPPNWLGSSNSNSIIVTPGSNGGTISVSAINNCGTSNPSILNISAGVNSTSASSIAATPAAICSGSSTILNIIGGNIGTNANWYLYSGSCGGTFIGNGSSISLTPTVSTTYYVRAEGACNTTGCVNTSVTVKTLSYAATSITGTTSICPGNSSTIQLNGGSLGTGANWNWYKSSCGGTYIKSGLAIVVSPSSSTTYYVRAIGMCNTTTCANTTVGLGTSSNAATSAVASPSVICSGAPTTLGVSGGNLGTGANWNWYTGSCTGTYIKSGISPVLSPTSTTVYYVRANGTCNTTICVSVDVTVNTISIAATSANANPSSICPASTTTLGITGGSLGTGANWNWYKGSCSGTYVKSGSSPVVNPSSTTTYYVRAIGVCNTTTCVNTTVALGTSSIAATSAVANPSTICPGLSTTLGLSGGSLGTSANWNWYTGSCGGTYIKSGISPVLSPSITTTYYVRAIGICNTTTCVNTTVTLNTASTAAISVLASPSSGCGSFSSTLSHNGGGLGTGGNWHWYSGSCGGTLLTTGITLVVSPSITKTYWLRAEGTCNITNCFSTFVKVNTLSNIANTVTGTTLICAGSASTLVLSGGNLGTGANWYWYTGSCGGALIDSGNQLVTSPTTSTNYYVRAEGLCNSTACKTTLITVNSTSAAPTSLPVSSSSICNGSSFTMYCNGGNLGQGAKWYWYTGSCGGILVSSKSTLVHSPSGTTVYYVRAEGYCNTTSCISRTIIVKELSSSADSIISSQSIICSGTTITINKTGGYQGTNAKWFWYSGACNNGTYISSAPSIVQNLTATTNYFVRAEGLCNTTICCSKSIILNTFSNDPLSAHSNLSQICSGNTSILYVNYSVIGSDAKWKWYSGSCGGIYVISGAAPVVIPPITTMYFVRAEGSCNTTLCASVTINVIPSPVAPLLAYTDRNNFCSNAGGNIVLAASGGSGQTFTWYKASCGGSLIGTGNPKITYAPVMNINYWARWQTTGCASSPCVSIHVTVFPAPTTPAVYASVYSLCSNSNGTITLTGSGGTGTTFSWYTGSCGSTLIGTGRSLIINSPASSTIYWGRLESIQCGNSSCKSTTISVISTIPAQPDTIIGNTQIVSGNTEIYKIIGVPGITYSWSLPSTWSGNSSSNSITLIVGSVPGIISVIPSNACGAGPVRTLDLSIYYSISGNFIYDSTNIPLDSVWVFLKSNGNKIDSVQTDLNGHYKFDKLLNGVYNITATTHKPWAGVNSTDAVKIKKHFAGSELFTSSIRLHSGDVNLSYGINTSDAVKIIRRFVGSDTSFSRGDWTFEKPHGGDTINVSTYNNDTVIVTGHNVIQNIKGLCIGDVNASYQPCQGSKIQSKLILNSFKTISLNSSEEYDIPILVTTDIKICAISLIFNYQKNLVNIENIQTPTNLDLEGLNYISIRNEIRIGWFETNGSINLKKGDTLLILKIKTTSDFKNGNVITFEIKNDPLCEFANDSGEPLKNVILNTYSIAHIGTINLSPLPNRLSNNIKLFPNPTNGNFTITYSKSKDGLINISLFNLLGVKICDILNETQLKGSYQREIDLTKLSEGIYMCKMLIEGNSVIVKKVFLIK